MLLAWDCEITFCTRDAEYSENVQHPLPLIELFFPPPQAAATEKHGI